MRTKPAASPREEYQLEENRRSNASPLLKQQYPYLQSVTMDLSYFDAERVGRTTQIKYTFNIDHLRSVFLIDCQNSECVGGDFDLSDIMRSAVLDRREEVSGELCCEGWRSHHTINNLPCGKILRFKILLTY